MEVVRHVHHFDFGQNVMLLTHNATLENNLCMHNTNIHGQNCLRTYIYTYCIFIGTGSKKGDRLAPLGNFREMYTALFILTVLFQVDHLVCDGS